MVYSDLLEKVRNLVDISYIRNKIFDFHNERRMGMLTSWGLYYDFRTTIDPEWNDYDKSVAKAHLSNWDKIIVGENGCPVDNEYELGDLADEIGL